jgi:hypothetical protein
MEASLGCLAAEFRENPQITVAQFPQKKEREHARPPVPTFRVTGR